MNVTIDETGQTSAAVAGKVHANPPWVVSALEYRVPEYEN